VLDEEQAAKYNKNLEENAARSNRWGGGGAGGFGGFGGFGR